MSIKITGKVVGVRIGRNDDRHLTIEFPDNPYFSLDVTDKDTFDLGNEVDVEITRHYGADTN